MLFPILLREQVSFKNMLLNLRNSLITPMKVNTILHFITQQCDVLLNQPFLLQNSLSNLVRSIDDLTPIF